MSWAESTAYDELPAIESGPRSVMWWGMLMLIVIEMVIVACLVFSYFYLRGGWAQWPPAGIQPPSLLVPSLSVPVLLLSAASMYWAESGIRKGSQGRLKLGLALSMALAVAFLALMAVDHGARAYTWQTNVYGSIVWAMTGFQVAHVLLLLVQGVLVGILAWQGHFHERRHMGVQAVVLYWYFVAAAWVPIFATVYLAPYVI